MRPRRRLVLKLGVFVIAGAIINVAVAWGSAFYVDALQNPLAVRSEELTEGVWLKYRDNGDQYKEFSAYTTREFASEFVLLTAFRSFGNGHGGYVNSHVLWRAGLPMPSFEADGSGYLGTELNPGIGLQGVLDAGMNLIKPERCLPLRPIFPGFAINTIFYAAILWLLLAAPGAIRRSLRRRRGQCPACAYPVGQSPTCTECGAELTLNAEKRKGIKAEMTA